MNSNSENNTDIIVIRHRYSGGIIFKGEKANLRGANLRDANLIRANLEGANLRGADLEGGLKSTGIYHRISNIGSEGGTLELYQVKHIGGAEQGKLDWFIKRGCFSGLKSEFLSAVEETHGGNKHGVKYKKIIEVFCND